MNILLIIIAIAWVLTSIYTFYLTYKLKCRCRKIEDDICRLNSVLYTITSDMAMLFYDKNKTAGSGFQRMDKDTEIKLAEIRKKLRHKNLSDIKELH